MKRSINYSHLDGISSAVVELPSKEPAVIQKREADLICDLVFAPDKRTGLPNSDISVYLAPNTPAQVREFIKQNIFGEGVERPGVPDGLDDDTILDLVRRSDETVDMYTARVSDFMNGERSRVQDFFAKVRNAERMKESKNV